MNPYYEDDRATIYCGDSMDVLPTIAAGSVHLVCTDPPYVIGAVSSGALASKSGGWQDMMNSAGWFTSWYREVDRVLKSSGSFWSFLNWRTLPVVMRAAVDAGLPITSLAVWDKEAHGQMIENDEPCMCGTPFTCLADDHDFEVARTSTLDGYAARNPAAEEAS